jgi:hypothetical protein
MNIILIQFLIFLDSYNRDDDQVNLISEPSPSQTNKETNNDSNVPISNDNLLLNN